MKKRFSEEQIIGLLREAEAGLQVRMTPSAHARQPAKKAVTLTPGTDQMPDAAETGGTPAVLASAYCLPMFGVAENARCNQAWPSVHLNHAVRRGSGARLLRPATRH